MQEILCTVHFNDIGTKRTNTLKNISEVVISKFKLYTKEQSLAEAPTGWNQFNDFPSFN